MSLTGAAVAAILLIGSVQWAAAVPLTIVRGQATTVVNSSATSSVTIARPSDGTAGDILVACLALNGSGIASAGVPAGWTLIAAQASTSNPHVFGFVKVLGPSEPPSYTWNLSTAVANSAGIARYTGVDFTTPLDAPATTAAGSSATSGALPSITTTRPGAMLVGCMALNSSTLSNTIGSPPQMTQVWDLGGKRHELADGFASAVGPTGPRTWSFNKKRDWAGWLVALRPGDSETTSPSPSTSPSPNPSPSGPNPSPSGPSPSPSGPSPTPVPPDGVPRLDHVFVVVLENLAYEQVIGSPEAPYLNYLASTWSSATDFHALTHPSLPNYLGLFAGDTFGLTTNCAPTDPGCSFAAPNLADRLDAAGLTWRGYFDSMPGPCWTTSSGAYTPRHNPFVYFDDIRLDEARCANGVRPFGDLAADLASEPTTRTFSLIVPDNCHNAHDCPLSTADGWLRSVLPPIFDSPAWAAGRSLLVVTFDEDDGRHDNRIYTALVGSSIRPASDVAAANDLYGLLRTFEASWSLAPLTAHDAAAAPLSGAFRTTPPADTSPPSTPTGLVANSPSHSQADLEWTTSTDDTAVAGYDLYRDGSWLASTTSTSYVDLTVAPSTTYAYRVRARDPETNVSGYSSTASTTTPAPPPPPPPTGEVVRESVSTTVNPTATASITIAQPSGVATGDVLVACIATNGGGVAAGGVPSGWTSIASAAGVANPHVFGYYHVAGAAEPGSWTWTLSGAIANGGGIARYSGVDTATPLDTAAQTGFGALASTATLPGLTTLTTGAMLVGCVGVNSSSTTLLITSPTGMTQAWDIGGKRHELADQVQAIVGATGARTWTFSSARDWAGWMVALRAR